MQIKEIRDDIEKLRRQNADFITVSNSEWYSLFKDEIRNSIAIEGVFTNRKELLDVLEKNKRTNKEKTAAILGYYESASAMYEYAHNQYKEEEFILRMSDIRQIHTILMRYEKEMGTYTGELGGFRRGDIEVTKATFKAISAFYVKFAMSLLVKWVNSKLRVLSYDRIDLAAMAHTWFETIHPFRDGNGRTGRILLSYVLIGTGFVNIAIKGISKSDRNKYYNALETCDECFEKINRDIEKGKNVTIKNVDDYIKKSDFTLLRNIIKKRLEKSIERMKNAHGVSLSSDAVVSLRQLAAVFDYSQDYLRNLINRKQLKALKRGKLWYVKIRDMQNYLESLSNKK